VTPIADQPASPWICIADKSAPVEEEPVITQTTINLGISPLRVRVLVCKSQAIGNVISEIEYHIPSGGVKECDTVAVAENGVVESGIRETSTSVV